MFETHKLNDKGMAEMAAFKAAMSDTVSVVLDHMKDGREKSIFITKIEEAVFFGAKAVASLPENHSEVIRY